MTLGRGDEPAVIANARLTGSERTDPFGAQLVDIHLADGIVADIAPPAHCRAAARCSTSTAAG